MSAVIDIVAEARRNTFYRHVVYTDGEISQLVVMSLLPNYEIGAERHRSVEQTIVIVSGFGTITLDRRERAVHPGDAIVITPGTYHNLVADSVLKLFTIYTPPNHIRGRIHRTRAEAEADIEDQEFGRAAGGY